MADSGYPNSQQTITVTTETSVTTIRFDSNYIYTLPGMLKIAQMVLNLLGFICIECGGTNYVNYSRGEYFEFVSMTGFWFTGILLAFYLFHIVEKFPKIPWLKIELVACLILSIFYLIAASLAVSFVVNAYIAAGFFGYCAMVVYGIDAFFKFNSSRAGHLAQGERVIKSTPEY